MGQTRSDINRQNTEDHIKHTFCMMYIETNSLEKIRVQDLCVRCKISRSLFYRYFEDKYQILQCISDELMDGIEKLNAAVQVSSNADYDAFLSTANFIKQNQLFFLTLIVKNRDSLFLYRWAKRLQHDLRLRLSNDPVFDKTHLSTMVVFLSAGIIDLYKDWVANGFPKTPEEIAHIGYNYVTHMITIRDNDNYKTS